MVRIMVRVRVRVMVRIMVRVSVRIKFSVWLVSCYAHVFVRLSVVIVTLPWWTTGQRGGANLAAAKTGDRSPKFQFGRSIINCRKSQRAPYDYNELRTGRDVVSARLRFHHICTPPSSPPPLLLI